MTDTSRAPPLQVSRLEPGTTLTLNRPPHGNALTTTELKQQLTDALADAAAEPETRAVGLTGASRAGSSASAQSPQT
jgi:enoyl-CoA hydratase/carnithine racemase